MLYVVYCPLSVGCRLYICCRLYVCCLLSVTDGRHSGTFLDVYWFFFLFFASIQCPLAWKNVFLCSTFNAMAIDGKVIMSFSVGVGGLWRISVSVKLCPEAVCYFGSHCQIYNCVIILTLFILMMQLLPWLFLGYSSATPPLFLGHFSATRLFLGHFSATTRLFLGHFLATPRLFPGHFSCCILFSVYAFVTAGGPSIWCHLLRHCSSRRWSDLEECWRWLLRRIPRSESARRSEKLHRWLVGKVLCRHLVAWERRASQGWAAMSWGELDSWIFVDICIHEDC